MTPLVHMVESLQHANPLALVVIVSVTGGAIRQHLKERQAAIAAAKPVPEWKQTLTHLRDMLVMVVAIAVMEKAVDGMLGSRYELMGISVAETFAVVHLGNIVWWVARYFLRFLL